MTRLTFFTLLVVGLTAIAAGNAYGQPKSSRETPSLLYQVTGKGISKPSYIFGTFHAICPTEMVPFESLDRYLDESDQLMMEIDMDDPAEMMAMTKGVMIPGGKTIKDFLKLCC
jgi:uncharacterized protein